MKLDAFITYRKEFAESRLLYFRLVWFVVLFSVKLGELDFPSTFFLPSLCVSHVFSSISYIYVLVFSGSSHWK